MNDKQEGSLAVAAAVLVLFSALLDPVITVVLSASLMVAFAIYKLVMHKKGTKGSE